MTSDKNKVPCILAMMLAMDKNKLIGNGGELPWHIPGELAYFKSVTMGKPVIMGRVTYDSIGKPLPGRPNFVVTRNADWHAEGVHVCTSLDMAIEGAKQYYAEQADNESANQSANDSVNDAQSPHEIMVIGGAGLCREAMPKTEKVYLTHIDHAYEGDIWFDSFDWNDWQVVSKSDMQHESLSFSYLVLERA